MARLAELPLLTPALTLDDADIAILDSAHRFEPEDLGGIVWPGMAEELSRNYVVELQRALRSGHFDQEDTCRALKIDEFDQPTCRRRAIRLMLRISRAYHITTDDLLVEGVEVTNRLLPSFSDHHADVFRGTYRNQVVAVKRLRCVDVSGLKEFEQGIRRLAMLWCQLHHAHVLPILGIDSASFAPWHAILTPWMEQGNLVTHVQSHFPSTFAINQLLRQTAQGLQYLHDHDVIHGDLRAANVLITDTLEACVSGFEYLSMDIDSGFSTTSAGFQGVRWLAPELLAGYDCKFNEHSDIYALGCVFIEAYTLEYPFSYIRREAEVVTRIASGERCTRPTPKECKAGTLSDSVWEIIVGCWSENPHDRPSALDVAASLGDLSAPSEASSEDETAKEELSENEYSEDESSEDEAHVIVAKLQEIFGLGQGDLDLETTETDTSLHQQATGAFLKRSQSAHRLSQRICLSDVSLHPQLEAGSLETAYIGKLGTKSVALNRTSIHHDERRHDHMQILFRKALRWQKLNHEHVVTVLGLYCIRPEQEYALVTPWLANGNLLQYIPRSSLCTACIIQLLEQAATGLDYLHDQGLLHGNLRAVNVLIGDNYEACLAGYDVYSNTDQISDPRWLAPELLSDYDSTPTEASDVYSLGRLCLEAYTLKSPFVDLIEDTTVAVAVLAGEHIRRPALNECHGHLLSDSMWSFMEKCWSQNPSFRPSALEASAVLNFLSSM